MTAPAAGAPGLAELGVREVIMLRALQEIEARLPACSADAETAWENRQWAGHYRDLQQIARRALHEAKSA